MYSIMMFTRIFFLCFMTLMISRRQCLPWNSAIDESGFTNGNTTKDIVESTDRSSTECNGDCMVKEVCSKEGNSSEPTCQCIDGFARLENGLCSECNENCSETEHCDFIEDVPVCLCLDGHMRNGEHCQECQCPENEICSFHENGSQICNCADGFSKNGGYCQECTCGEHEDCSFEMGEKKCSCKEGYLKQDNICISCGCDKTEVCVLDIHGKFECVCKEHYVEYLGQCTECQCEDENAVCEFRDSWKVCPCKDGYIDTGSGCKASIDGNFLTTEDVTLRRPIECTCGENEDCSFETGQQNCFCKEGYLEQNGICTDCGCEIDLHEECYLDDTGKPNCRCKKNYAPVYEICEECLCEDDNAVCEFQVDGLKACHCKDGYIETEGSCKDPNVLTTEDATLETPMGCQCEENARCSSENGANTCLCLPGFAKNGTRCAECKCGENEDCSFEMGRESCSCKEGYLEQNGICTDCDCAIDLHEECYLDTTGKPNCRCKKNYARFHDICRECICNDKNAICYFGDGGIPDCKCPEQYLKVGDSCKETATVATTRSTYTEIIVHTSTEKRKVTITSDVSSTVTEAELIKSTSEVILNSTTEERKIITTSTEFPTKTDNESSESISVSMKTKITSTSSVLSTASTPTHVETSKETKSTDVPASTEAIDPCDPSPCKSNRTCKGDGTNYRCICTRPFVGEICEKVSCKPNPCLVGNCLLISETEYLCSCNGSNDSYGCSRELNVAGTDSKTWAIVSGSVTGVSIVILVLVFSGLKFWRRRKRAEYGHYIQDSEYSTPRNSKCDIRIPTPQEIPNIL